MGSDIFDTSDMSDIPPELMRELNFVSRVDLKLLSLFVQAGKPLDLSKLLIGYYRKYKVVVKRTYIMTNCYRISKKGYLKATKNKGEYKITDDGQLFAEKLLTKEPRP